MSETSELVVTLGSASGRRAAFSAYGYNYAELGWPLIRIRGKRPFERSWQTTAPIEPDSAATLWAEWGEQHNMGVVLHPAKLAVLEYDREEARGQFFALLGGDFPLTPICRTGSGRHHVYFDDPGGIKKGAREGLELRVGTHQCLVPPSLHPDTGKPYQWLQGYEPWTLEPLPLPGHIRAWFEAVPPQTETAAPSRDTPPPQVETTALSRDVLPPQAEGVWGGRFLDARSALAIAALLGLDFPRTACPLHDDRNPSGSFFEGRRGEWVYHCHAGCGAYSLPGLWLRAKYNVRPEWVSRTEFALWCRRLGIELGWSACADKLPSLPATFPASVARYWNGYRLLVVCERLSGSTAWPLYTHDFSVRWCGLPRSTARGARTTLMKAGWIETTGETVSIRGYDKAHRWRPGPRALDQHVPTRAHTRAHVEPAEVTPWSAVQEPLVDASAVAEHLGVTRGYVYEHAAELGARRLGSGPRARLRFSLAEVDERLSACSTSRESDASESAQTGALRRRPARRTGTSAELLPIRGRIRPESRLREVS